MYALRRIVCLPIVNIIDYLHHQIINIYFYIVYVIGSFMALDILISALVPSIDRRNYSCPWSVDFLPAVTSLLTKIVVIPLETI